METAGVRQTYLTTNELLVPLHKIKSLSTGNYFAYRVRINLSGD